MKQLLLLPIATFNQHDVAHKCAEIYERIEDKSWSKVLPALLVELLSATVPSSFTTSELCVHTTCQQ